MSVDSLNKFWVVCCEETEVTGEIARTVENWQLAGVRSLIGDRQTLLSHTDTIADASYVIFVTPDDQPGSQAKVRPLNILRSADTSAETINEKSPVKMMTSALKRHGRTPQSWLLQLPTTEARTQPVQPVSTRKSVAQAISTIEVFVRNYTRATPFTIPAQPSAKEQTQKEVVLSHYRRI